MTSDTSIRNEVRRRSGCRCEFCGISETDSGGDHPKSKGGDVRKKTDNNAVFVRLRRFRGKLPAEFKLDRDEASART